MRFSILAAAALAALPAIAQDVADSEALLRMALGQLRAQADGGELTLPGEAQAEVRATGTPAEREEALRESFGGAGLTAGGLTAVACDGPRCTAEVALAAQNPVAIAAAMRAVEDWIAASSPCPYAMAASLGDAPRVRAAIDCAE